MLLTTSASKLNTAIRVPTNALTVMAAVPLAVKALISHVAVVLDIHVVVLQASDPVIVVGVEL